MDLKLTGKTALVCGASKGIGAAIARALAAEGAKVILVARNEEELKKSTSELNGSGHIYLTADFSKKRDVDTLISKIQTLPVSIVINNTGGPPPGPLANATEEQFMEAFQMHLFASHKLMLAVLPGMKDSGYGRFINVISTSVRIPIPGLGVSNTTRGAMASWSKTLSAELAPFGITVNNILPGAVETTRLEAIFENVAGKQGITKQAAADEMRKSIPAGRFGLPEELGDLAAFLASERAAYITGVNIPVDGGRTGSI